MIVLTISCGLLQVFGSEEQPVDVKVRLSTAQELILEYYPVYQNPQQVISQGNEFTRYYFEGGRQEENQPQGSPEIFLRSLLLNFPGTSNNSVEVTTVDYEDIPNIMLVPVPMLRGGELGPVLEYSPDATHYGHAGFLPQNIAALANIGEARGVFLGELRLYPLQYDPALRTLRKYTRIVVRVRFGERETPTVQPDRSIVGLSLNKEAFEVSQIPVAVSKQKALRNSVLSSGPWFRLTVSEDGIYKLTGQTLLNAGIPSSTDPHTIQIYGNGGFETPSDVNAPYIDDLLANAVYVHDEGNARQLDASDYIIFYGKGTRGWKYNPSNKTFSHYINHFTETNVYWLTYGTAPSKMMAEVSSLSDNVFFQPSTVQGKLFREDDKVNILSSGQEWLGQVFNVGDQITYVHPLPGLDVTQPIRYKFHVGARSRGFSTFDIYEHSQRLLTTPSIPGVNVGDYTLQFAETSPRELQISQIPTFNDGQSHLRFAFNSTNSTGNGYIDWYEIFYRQHLVAQSDVFSFHSDDTTAIVEYNVTGFTGGGVLVFDVTRFDSVFRIVNVRLSADSCSFKVALNAGSVREFYVVGPNGFKTPGVLTRVTNQNLHGDITEVQYVIITHPDFMDAARRLKNFREQPGDQFLSTIVVDVNQIYNEFGGGLQSPMAVRNYLRYIYTNWSSPPKYVLLFGDGDYDYKRITATGTNWMPPWETPNSFYPLSSYATDDDFVNLTNDLRIDIAVGRLTARSPQEANTMVDKIIEYESSPVQDPWKLRSTFVADDGLQGLNPNGTIANDGFIHICQVEGSPECGYYAGRGISQLVPTMFEKRKIYLYEYPTVYAAAGRRKPDVNIAIRNQINQGTLILNFTGHGNPRVWAHENVFVREADFPLLTNKGKYFFLVAATCNYSHFDILSEQSGSEMLVAMQDAGAIAVVSATRAVYADPNHVLNLTLYRHLFQTDTQGKLLTPRLGDAWYSTKQSLTSDNDRKFFLLGDPALRIGFPKLYATIDSINRVSTSQVVQLQALSRASVSATVRDSQSNQGGGYSGNAELVVYDADRTIQINDPLSGIFTYKTRGEILFRGQHTIQDGLMNANFVIPKDISYNNDFGRMTLYFSNSTIDGAGYSTSFRVGGTDTTAAPDAKGPEIQLYLDRRDFRSGDVVSESPLLIAELFDTSGINTSGASVGHRLEAWTDDSPQGINLNDYYKSKLDTYQEGTVEYPLGTLSPGTHKLRMRAWDTFNNSSTEETVFDVVTSIGLRLSNVYNYPNPFTSLTVFTFEHNQVLVIDTEVKIYTVAGRLIHALKMPNVTTPFVQIPWDGRDRDGDLVANGIYLYKVIAKTQDGRFSSEALGKLSVLR
ncbi:MAG: type IX secretion system sortase PorU [Ignavibacteriae bacterium]|nr:type IX secretion system sortase PorU [Ignavibacteriota bacterium]